MEQREKEAQKVSLETKECRLVLSRVHTYVREHVCQIYYNSCTSLQGPNGDPGETGMQGIEGMMGDVGDKGRKGGPGIIGEKGKMVSYMHVHHVLQKKNSSV